MDSNVESPTVSRAQNESTDPDPESGDHDFESEDQDQDQYVYDGTQHLKKEPLSRLNSRRATDFSQVQISVFKQKFQRYYITLHTVYEHCKFWFRTELVMYRASNVQSW